jgi:hypothetical protein
LWSFWSSESVSHWLSLWSAALVPPTAEQIRAVAIVVLAGALLIGLFWLWKTWVTERISQHLGLRGAVVLAQLLVLNAISISAVHRHVPSISQLVLTARFGGLNQPEMEALERGYYEDLLTVDRFNGELAALYMKRPPEWSRTLADLGLVQPAPGLRYALRPGSEANFRGATLRTNQWGMHDQEYPQQKPLDCYRIALLGASHAMGVGVECDRTFESILERRLNDERAATRFRGFEILNLAVYGYAPIEQVRIVTDKVPMFDPDAVIYVGHPGDASRVVQYVADVLQSDTPPDHPYLAEIGRRAGIAADTPPRLARRQLVPYGDEMLSWVYRQIASTCQAQGILPVFARLPMVPDSYVPADDANELTLARDAGFVLLNLDNVYEGHDRDRLWIAEWDAHPNTLGHELIANQLYRLIGRDEDPLGLRHQSAGHTFRNGKLPRHVESDD